MESVTEKLGVLKHHSNLAHEMVRKRWYLVDAADDHVLASCS